MYKLSSDIVILQDCAFNKRSGEAYILDGNEKSLLSESNLDVKIRELGRTKEINNLLANGIIVDDSFCEDKEIFHVQWHLLNSCNLKCKHCYDWKENINTLSLGQMYKVVDDFVFFLKKADFNGEISLTGGEPTLFEHLPELIKYIKTRDVHIALFILSNGIFFSETLIELLQKYNVGVQVSLDGLQKTHDAIRGKGTYSKVVATMKHLKDNGINVGIHYVIMKRNISEVEYFVYEMERLGMDRINFSTLIPIGPGASENVATCIEMKACMEKIVELQKKVNISIIGQRPLWAILGYEGVCPVGYRTLTIDAKGDFLPCRRLPIRLGNVLEDSWFDVWFNNEILCKMREREKNLTKCGKCIHLLKCSGCRAMAYAIHGDPFAPDDYCWLSV